MKLSAKIFVVLVTITSASITTYSIIESRRAAAEYSNDAKIKYTTSISSVLPGLAKAIWNMDKNLASTNLSALFELGEVHRIAVFDESGKAFLAIEPDIKTYKDGFNPTTKKVETTTVTIEENASEFLNKTGTKTDLNQPIMKFSESPLAWVAPAISLTLYEHRLIAALYEKEEGEDARFIGHTVVDFSTNFVKERIIAMRMRIALFAFVLVTLILGFTYFFLRRSILLRLIMLEKASIEIANGNFVRVPKQTDRDEITNLSLNFNLMVDALQSDIEHLHLIESKGRKISASITFKDLATEIKRAFCEIARKDLKITLFIHSSMLPERQFMDNYFEIDDNGEPKTGNENSNSNIHSTVDMFLIEILHPKEERKIALIVVKKSDGLDKHVLSVFSALRASVANALSNIEFVARQRQLERSKAELETARLVQQTLIPPTKLLRIGPFQMTSHFQSASECGGDWWGYYPLSDGRLLLLLGDVTGHGTPSAFVTAVIKGYCDALFSRKDISVSQILHELHLEVKCCSKGNLLMTMFGCIIDSVKHTLTYSNAAHNHPFLLQNIDNKTKISRITKTGRRLGFVESQEEEKELWKRDRALYHDKVIDFPVGTTFMVFSDGLIEWENHENAQYSDFRLKRLLATCNACDLEGIRTTVIQKITEFSQGKEQGDDVTFFIARQDAEWSGSWEESHDLPPMCRFKGDSVQETALANSGQEPTVEEIHERVAAASV